MESAVTAAALLYVIGGCVGSGAGQRRKCTQKKRQSAEELQATQETAGLQREERSFLSDTGAQESRIPVRLSVRLMFQEIE